MMIRRLLSKGSPRQALNISRGLSAVVTKNRAVPKDGLTLTDFIQSKQNESASASALASALATASAIHANGATTFHIKTYGCQMNVSDTDIVRALLLNAGYTETLVEMDATVLLTNTCAIRENAEQKVWGRLREQRAHYKTKKQPKKIVGVLGCMAERLKEDMLKDGLADLVVGPDAYRELPNLISVLLDTETDTETAVNVQLSLEETYADVSPVRSSPDDISAFVSVMRGCNNMCSYCVVPFTRGRERSRPMDSILGEIQQLVQEQDVKEIVLLGQNVNSYHDRSDAAVQRQPASEYTTSNDGFTNMYRLRGGAGHYFADLVAAVSDISPEVRVRFTSPHPKDYPLELLQLMAERPNVCNQLHMPAQSGSSSCLERMRRGYTREAYLELIDDVRATIPDVAISSDFIAGFCGETEDEHRDTISLMEQIQFDQAYMFAYSMRGKTHAHRKLQDDVMEEVKQKRLQEVINTFRSQVQTRNETVEVGRLRLVLVEGESKKSRPETPAWSGRTDQNKRIVFPTMDMACFDDGMVPSLLQGGRVNDFPHVPVTKGDYVVVQVTESRGHTLRGKVLWRTTLSKFTEMNLTVDHEAALKDALASQTSVDSLTAHDRS
jgi:MiaB/RimO family radical SAM methylthiotransferase